MDGVKVGEPGWVHKVDIRKLPAALKTRAMFESSVLGPGALMPPPERADEFVAATTDVSLCGQDTTFGQPTRMPRRFTADALGEINQRHRDAKPINPIYATTSSEIGRLPMQEADLPMRSYPLDNRFTNSHVLGTARPQNRINSGLNVAMDRSRIHRSMDTLTKIGLKDHNIANLSAARIAMREGRA